jgi:hypothetical protein
MKILNVNLPRPVDPLPLHSSPQESSLFHSPSLMTNFLNPFLSPGSIDPLRKHPLFWRVAQDKMAGTITASLMVGV